MTIGFFVIVSRGPFFSVIEFVLLSIVVDLEFSLTSEFAWVLDKLFP